jgi:cell division protein FtsB
MPAADEPDRPPRDEDDSSGARGASDGVRADSDGEKRGSERREPERARRREAGSRGGASRGGERSRGGARGGRRPQSARRTRPRDGRPGRPVSPEREPDSRRSRTVRAAAAFGLSTTRRAAVLAIVVCALALSVAVPLRTYLSQRDEVRTQEQRQADLRAQVEALEKRKAQLEDPAQVEAEARRRLRYVMPGETPYMVELPDDTRKPGGGKEKPEHALDESWYLELWNAVSGR